MGSTRNTLFFKDKPLFGLDIGTGTAKVMQIDIEAKRKRSVTGYGMARFDPKSMKNGEILDVKPAAKAIKDMFRSGLIGDISTRRVALSVPTFRTFTHEVQLPKMSNKELYEAVQAEAEQYIPRQLDELYLDYTITAKTDTEITVYIVAVTKNIVDSYMNLSHTLGLEVVFIEPSILASTRLLELDTHNEIPGVLLDFGTRSADISIFHKHVTVTGTVQSGGDLFTEHIKESLGVSSAEASLIKTKYGLSLSKKQAEIRSAVEPLLDQTIKEVKRMVRYYEERGGDETAKIGQIITMGGGANMPGLNDYLTEHLRLPVRMFDPWQVLDYGKLKPPDYSERSMYMTVAGLGLAHPREVVTS